MSFWKLRESSPLKPWVKRLVGSLLLAILPLSGSAQTPSGASLKVTLVGVTSYSDFQEIKAAVVQAEGVENLSLDTEAPGVVTFRLNYRGEPKGLIDKFSTLFPDKYKLVEKTLPSGLREIQISR